MRCIVQNCTNDTKRTTKRHGITFHMFPKEASLRTKWLEALGKMDWEPKYRSSVCSEHFRSEDFYKTKFGLRKIKNGAIPVHEQDSIEDLNASAVLKVCRICLATDRKLYHIADYKLDLPYQEITGLLPSEDDNLPQKLCWECTHRLVSCHRFRNKAIMSQRLMTDLLSTETHLTLKSVKSLSQRENSLNSTLTQKIYQQPEYCDIRVKEETLAEKTSINDINETIILKDEVNDESGNEGFVNRVLSKINKDMEDGDKLDLKENVVQNKEVTVIIESIDTSQDHNMDVNYDKADVTEDLQEEKYEVNMSIMEPEVKIDEETIVNHSDSNKDVCIKKVKPKKDQAIEKKEKRVRSRKKKNNQTTDESKISRKKGPKYELVDSLFTVTKLTFEEQIEEISRRQETDSYKNAPYKCDICYIGFHRKYRCDVHKVKHSKESGDYECPVCRTRMMTKRAQKNHIGSLHTEKLACSRCDFVTKHRGVAIRHLEWHDGTTYKCPHCPSEFKKRSSYFGHLRLKHVSDFVCEICGYTFLSKKGVYGHKKRKHKMKRGSPSCLEGPYCEVCEVSFASQTAYDTHLKVSSKHSTDDDPNRIRNDYIGVDHPIQSVGRGKGRPLANSSRPEPKLVDCEQCGVQLRGMMKYMYHFKREHPDKHRTKYPNVKGSVMCDQCGKIFHTKALLVDHMWVHTGEKRFKCSLCDKSFSMHCNLVNHQIVHSEQRPVYDCEICGKGFLFPANLKRHMIVHSGIKPFKCDVCEKTFKSNAEKRLHYEHVHLKKPWPRRSHRTHRNRAEHYKRQP
ncbi:PREDICTED: zinc finger protein 665-like isoform X2 [Papilio polytes]|uniref:zinc finger protein 665-like isoform X2 n=1 Tax=Papilio polytes TaxID=76194 RepID=UPI000675C782|nr:PREDICTED: zinc finger protein 665-like isoform X2 [Papilio polytes]